MRRKRKYIKRRVAGTFSSYRSSSGGLPKTVDLILLDKLLNFLQLALRDDFLASHMDLKLATSGLKIKFLLSAGKITSYFRAGFNSFDSAETLGGHLLGQPLSKSLPVSDSLYSRSATVLTIAFLCALAETLLPLATFPALGLRISRAASLARLPLLRTFLIRVRTV